MAGGGPAGLIAALAVAHEVRAHEVGPHEGAHEVGAQARAGVTLMAPGIGADYRPGDRERDTRTTALMGGSVALLDALDLWEGDGGVRAVSTPLEAIRIIDDRGGLFRAPELLFEAKEIGRADFGVNVRNAALVDVLHKAAVAHDRITMVAQAVAEVELSETGVKLRTADGAVVDADVVVAADGRGSMVRQAAGIGVTTYPYPQHAVATAFAHRKPHRNVSSELHRAAGPLTTVPLGDDSDGRHWSSLVWVETPGEAERLMALDELAFRAELELRLMGLLGVVLETSRRATFPLVTMQASTLAAKRVLLAGEAAHVVPPIGAQGLNLGFRDAAVAAELIGQARADGRDVGSADVMAAYAMARRADILSREAMTDLLNRSLLSDMVPVQALRGLGLQALSTIGPLRRFAMRVGLDPPGVLPRL
ncbi:MAG: FAD-dependent monooxygenase, partial [Hyphomicrobiaceae bacterium]